MGGILEEVIGIPIEPEAPVAPVEPKEPIEPKEPVEPVEPTEPTEPVEPKEPVEPSEPVEPAEPTEPTEPKEPVEPTEPVEVKPDESLISLAKEINPDGEFADNQSAISVIKEDIKEKTEFIEKAQKWNQELIDVFENNPEVGEFTKAVINGMDPVVAAGVYISETLAPEEGEKNYETYKEEVKRRKEQGEQRKALEQEFSTNVGISKNTVQEFVKENSIDEKEMESIAKEFDDEMINFRKGITTKKFLTLLWKGKTFDAKVKKAEEQAYLRGKNEKITLVKKKNNTGDGLPDLKSSVKPDKEIPKPGMFERAADHKRGG